MNKQSNEIHIPTDIDQAITNGMMRGREKMRRRNQLYKNTLKTVASIGVVVGIFATSVNVIPTFAASIKEIPVLGTLVKIFQINKEQVSGGSTKESAEGKINLIRNADNEQLVIQFGASEEANLYSAKYEKNPQSITITLPGTSKVSALSDFKRADGESDYIKSVYELITLDDSMVRYVVEIENSSDVQISEYKNPGQIVIELKENSGQNLQEIYSVRSYSFDNNEAFARLEEKLVGTEYRILKDDTERRFIEFAQFSTEAEAKAWSETFDKMPVVIEKRFGNNVPVTFVEGTTDYDNFKFEEKYVAFLQTATTPEEIMQFIDENKDQYPEQLDLMLRGLTGMLRGMDASQYDKATVNKYYGLVGKTLDDFMK